MDRYYFITCDDLLFTIKTNDLYDLPKDPFEPPFKIKDKYIHKIINKNQTYELVFCIADIDFPNVTDNWKRRTSLAMCRHTTNVLLEGLELYHPRVRSAVFPIIDSDKIVLVRPFYLDYYEIPGGAIEYCCSPEQASIKEAFEEANIEIRIKQFLRTRSYILEQISPTIRLNPQWFLSIEFIGEVVSGIPSPKNEIVEVIVEKIDTILDEKTSINIRNDLREGLIKVKQNLK